MWMLILANKLNRIMLKLEREGYKIRRHYYEYYVRYDDRFICVATLFPEWGYMFILLRPGERKHVERISRIIREEFQSIRKEILKEAGCDVKSL